MTCTQVDRLETISFLAIKNNCKTISTPYLIFGVIFSIFDFALYVCTVCPVKISSQSSLSDFTKNPFPCKPEFNLIPKITPWFLIKMSDPDESGDFPCCLVHSAFVAQA
jgi:hypothetical protein